MTNQQVVFYLFPWGGERGERKKENKKLRSVFFSCIQLFKMMTMMFPKIDLRLNLRFSYFNNLLKKNTMFTRCGNFFFFFFAIQNYYQTHTSSSSHILLLLLSHLNSNVYYLFICFSFSYFSLLSIIIIILMMITR